MMILSLNFRLIGFPHPNENAKPLLKNEKTLWALTVCKGFQNLLWKIRDLHIRIDR